MRLMIHGLRGWMTMRGARNESLRQVDFGITAVATLMVAATWALLR